ncbi:MAG: MBL fold metallo-hydrolase, partial [Bdellovibrionales bacterium]|nr:MBL fold metallo-hydrolase [Bdellovibrionales bacterium]
MNSDVKEQQANEQLPQPKLTIETVVVTPFQQNCRVVSDSRNGRAVVIDPGGDIERIVAVLDRTGCSVEAIFLTHSHIDHAGGVTKLERDLAARGNPRPALIAHAAEAEMRRTIDMQARMFGLPER